MKQPLLFKMCMRHMWLIVWMGIYASMAAAPHPREIPDFNTAVGGELDTMRQKVEPFYEVASNIKTATTHEILLELVVPPTRHPVGGNIELKFAKPFIAGLTITITHVGPNFRATGTSYITGASDEEWADSIIRIELLDLASDTLQGFIRIDIEYGNRDRGYDNDLIDGDGILLAEIIKPTGPTGILPNKVVSFGMTHSNEEAPLDGMGGGPPLLSDTAAETSTPLIEPIILEEREPAEAASQPRIAIAPNPASESCYLFNSNKETSKVFIHNLAGQKVFETIIPGGTQGYVDIHTLPPGLYMVSTEESPQKKMRLVVSR